MSAAVIQIPRKLRRVYFGPNKAHQPAPCSAMVIAIPSARLFREPGAPVPASPVKVFPPKPRPNTPPIGRHAPRKPRPIEGAA